MREELAALWSDLPDERSADGGWRRLRVAKVAGAPVYVARSLTTGLEGLVLEIPISCVPAGDPLPESQGFEVLTEPLVPGPNGTTRIILALTSPAFRDVFLALARDIAETLIPLEGPGATADTFVARIRRWQRFLEAHGPGGLSESERRGLFGELLILRRLLGSGGDKGVALSGWKGPEGEAHDFVLAGGDVEVKTTASLSPSNVSISNLEQLDDTACAELVLVHIVLAENPTVGASLPELVGEVTELSVDAVGLLEQRLFAAGYLAEHELRYSLPRYQVVAERAFRITADFPRLVDGNVPEGVTAARYSISLAALSPFAVNDFRPEALLSG